MDKNLITKMLKKDYDKFIITYESTDRYSNYKKWVHEETLETDKDYQLWIAGDLLYINIPYRYCVLSIPISDIKDIKGVTKLI